MHTISQHVFEPRTPSNACVYCGRLGPNYCATCRAYICTNDSCQDRHDRNTKSGVYSMKA